MRVGRVTAFDDPRGLGEITDRDSDEVVPFHCIDLADGTRTVDVGTEVTFASRRKLGRLEAVCIEHR